MSTRLDFVTLFLGTAIKLKLYNAFILPHFQYCSTVCHFCSATVKNQNPLISAPYVLFIEIKFCPTSGYYIIQKEQLFTTKGYKIYKSFPKYLKDMLTLRQSVYYSSRRTNILSLCKPTTTTTYSLNSFCYFASKKWNSLPNNVTSEPTK